MGNFNFDTTPYGIISYCFDLFLLFLFLLWVFICNRIFPECSS